MAHIQKKIITPEEEEREFQRKVALEKIEVLHEGTTNFESLISWIKLRIEKGCFTLEEIGVTEKDLKEFLTNGYKLLAQEDLHILRQETQHYSICLRRLRLVAQEGEFTLEEIGTSEEELEILRIKGHKILARQYLLYLRSETMNHRSFFEFLKTELKKGEFTLEEIGTNEEELEELGSTSIQN